MATILKYVSQGGTVKMGGALSNIRITALSGFELPPKQYETIEFATENGVTTTGSKDMARTLTISGNIYGGQRDISKILKALYYEGTLYCEFGTVRRKIDCKVINMSDVERLGQSGINSFTVQLQADYPYFNDYTDTTTVISSSQDLINGTFTLPCVWTEYIQSGIVNNTGDKLIFPVITLTAVSSAESTTGTVSVTNETTGAAITLDYVIAENEVITIDLSTRRIKSSINGNITNVITDDTVLSEFYLDYGKNNIAFSSSAENQVLLAEITFNRLYLMAVR